MVLSWRDRRKYLYLSVVAVFVVVALFFIWDTFFYKVATCSDGVQNAGEHGIDCGGSCALICQNESRPPTVLWARAFPTGSNTYTAAAYLQNNMVGAGARSTRYSFQLFDARNVLITEKTGVADLPPNQTIPLVETNINVGNRTVAYTQFTFTAVPVWSRVLANAITPVRIANQVLAPDGSRLSATIYNESVKDIPRVTVVAVLFDNDGVARAASKSIVQSLDHKSSQSLVFTWGAPTLNVARAEVTVLPEF